jgi:hypothetical protein
MSPSYTDGFGTEERPGDTDREPGALFDGVLGKEESEANLLTVSNRVSVSRTEQRHHGLLSPSAECEKKMLEQIANFSAGLDDLVAVVGPGTAGEVETGLGGPREGFTFSEEEILVQLRRWKSAGLVKLDKTAGGQRDLYVSTDRGMSRAGFPDWDKGLYEPRDSALLDRGGERGRLLASVGAALELIIRTDEAYRDFRLLSVWGIRRQRRVNARYRFELSLSGHRHCPAAVLDPRDRQQNKATVVEVFDGTQKREHIESICRVMSKRKDVGHLRCYTTSHDLPILLEVVRRLDVSDRVSIYAIPEGADALTVAGLVPESVLSASEMTAQERKLQVALLHCVGEFGSASFAGLRDYLDLEEDLLRHLIEKSLEDGLLEQPRYTCDSVELLWLTESGCNRTGTKVSTDPVTFEQAWLEKETLRVAILVAARYPSRRMTNARILARKRRKMPTLGPAELGCSPALLVSRDIEDRSPVAVVIVIGMRTEAQLLQMVEACVADRKTSHILIYINREMIETLKSIVSSRDDHKRITVKMLPASERAQHERVVESKRREALADRAAVQERRIEREAARARRAAEPQTRSERHEPEVDGLRPIIDEVWNPFNALLNERLDEKDLARHRVSTRLIMNLLVWIAENKVPVANLRSASHGASAQAFRTRLESVQRVGLLAEFRKLVEEHEDRGSLNWGSYGVTVGQGGPVREQIDKRRSDRDGRARIDSMEGEDVFALLERLKLDK